MTRLFRNLLYLTVGLLLGGLFTLAHAVSVPAVPGSVDPTITAWKVSGWNNGPFSSPMEACQAYLPLYAGESAVASASVSMLNVLTYSCHWSGGTVSNNILAQTPYCAANQTFNGSTLKCDGALVCPDSTYTLVGQNCVKPDQPCQESQIQRDGECVCDPSVLAAFPSQYGAAMQGTGSSPSSACVGGCMRSTGSFCLGGGGTWWCDGGAWTSEKCTGGATNTPKPENKKPPCSPTEGVLTSSSGTVACVPEGIPNARKPVVEKSQTKTTAPNGDVETQEKTTTKDPATGATHSETSTTNSQGTTTEEKDSGTDGKGGVAGDNSGNEPGDCAKEPDSPLCKKGTVKEKGEFGDGQDAELNAAKGELRAKFAEIKAAALGLFNSGSSSSGGGALPCYAPVMVLGHAFSLCLSQYADKLAPIGGFMIFAASLLGIFIVLRR